MFLMEQSRHITVLHLLKMVLEVLIISLMVGTQVLNSSKRIKHIPQHLKKKAISPSHQLNMKQKMATPWMILTVRLGLTLISKVKLIRLESHH